VTLRQLPRVLVLIGSGEMAPQMGRVHRSVISALSAGSASGAVTAAVIDTPYGFQENAAAISADALDYFGRRLGLVATLASLPRADVDILVREQAYASLRAADLVFSGPGSPSYALSQWSSTEIPTIFADKLLSGGALVLASAAALTVGRFSAPIYEMYKAGEDPYWLPGLDVLSVVGIQAAVIPHWNNGEGTTHDTRFCFLGERRLRRLEEQLPTDVMILGVDEHTALVVDFDARRATVRGRGNVTIRYAGNEDSIEKGQEVPLEALTRSATALPARPSTAKNRSRDVGRDVELAQRIVNLEADSERLLARVRLVEPLIRELIELRKRARSAGDYATADKIRTHLAELGVELTDSADGTSSFRIGR
jgi:cyanophycinase-like exopeptidase